MEVIRYENKKRYASDSTVPLAEMFLQNIYKKKIAQAYLYVTMNVTGLKLEEKYLVKVTG